ncbi:mycothiol S-conjugate amidase [Austwickia chelonae]|uniref:Mycothiol S-conjugate amidase n=2 Tax=Austwickia TaxID=1184606 RepID=K6UMD6_9MICO|nr:mycothiol conjugate amidase [Austwickia chelonae NBRC 105200]SEV94605.1 mycothiol S-conjugate amidase [Austwickia chelonae]
MTQRTEWRLMAVHAHPDDESSKGAATSARYVAQGARVMVVSCTGGERGDVLNPRLQHDADLLRDLPEFRRQEMARAQEILGVEHTWLGFVDSGYPEGDPLPPLPHGCFAAEPLTVTTEALVRVMREFRPHVVTTYDEHGGYPHPDHVMTHLVGVSAFRAAGDPGAFPHAGEPWQPLKLYYNQTIALERMRALHEALEGLGMVSPYGDWLRRRSGLPRRDVTTRVACGEYFEQRNAALMAHATQIDPDGWWFAAPLDVERRVWPHEDFEAAISYVGIAVGEDDLFAGLGDPVAADEFAVRIAREVARPVYDVVKEAS